MTDTWDPEEARRILGPYANYFDLTKPGADDENENWLKSAGWGDLPKDGPGLLTYLGVLDAPRAEQREALNRLRESGRLSSAPAKVRDHLIAVALADPEDFDGTG